MPTWSKPNPRSTDFHCSTAWHLKQSARCLAIYALVGSVTSGGKTPFFAKITRVASYFDWSYETTRKAFHVLRKLGFLEAIQPGYYKFIEHREWTKKYPGQCIKRAELPWQGEVDPLVGKMYGMSGGKLRMMPHHVAALRKYANDDDALIVSLFTAEIQASIAAGERGQYTGNTPNSCRYRVLVQLRNSWLQKQAQQNAANNKIPR
jgi:hypothetical protein